MSEPREFVNRLSTLVINHRTPMDRHYGDEITVIEKLPESIQITKEKLIQVFARAYCTKPNQHKILDSDLIMTMCKELFGDEGKV